MTKEGINANNMTIEKMGLLANFIHLLILKSIINTFKVVFGLCSLKGFSPCCDNLQTDSTN